MEFRRIPCDSGITLPLCLSSLAVLNIASGSGTESAETESEGIPWNSAEFLAIPESHFHYVYLLWQCLTLRADPELNLQKRNQKEFHGIPGNSLPFRNHTSIMFIFFGSA